jgi:hypothetical protein
MNRISLIIAAALLAACSQSPSSVRVTNDVPQPVPAKPAGLARSEPIFYNGKTYKLNMVLAADGTTAVTVMGMAASQQKDALGLTTSAFHHFTCKDSQKANILGKPVYAGGQWNLTAQCG